MQIVRVVRFVRIWFMQGAHAECTGCMLLAWPFPVHSLHILLCNANKIARSDPQVRSPKVGVLRVAPPVACQTFHLALYVRQTVLPRACQSPPPGPPLSPRAGPALRGHKGCSQSISAKILCMWPYREGYPALVLSTETWLMLQDDHRSVQGPFANSSPQSLGRLFP